MRRTHRLQVYDADPSDVANFLTTAFKAADADSDTEVTRTEFMEGSKHVSDAMMAGFVRGSGYRRRAAQARALASRTWRRTLEWVANQKPR